MSLEALSEYYSRLAGEYRALAEQLASNKFLHILFRIGNFRTKIFIVMLLDVRPWRVVELSRFFNLPPGNVLRALKQLEKEDLVRRISRGTWKINL